MTEINSLYKNIKPSMIREMHKLKESMKNPVNLSIGVPFHKPFKKYKDGLDEANKKNISSYTSSLGIDSLREEIAKYLKIKNINAEKENIAVSAGTTMMLNTLIEVIGNKGTNIAILKPNFVIYPEQIKLKYKNPVLIDFDKKTLLPNIEDFKNKANQYKFKLIILNTPNNPTGVVYPKKILEAIAKIAKQNNSWIISDQIYEEFLYDNREYTNMIELYDKTITVSGPSKSLAIPGHRLAYAHVPDKEIIKNLETALLYTQVNAPSNNQYAYEYALKKDVYANVKKIIKEYELRRNMLYEGLKEKYEIPVKPQGAFYLFVKIPDKLKKDFFQKTIEKEVLVVPGETFNTPDYFRVSYSINNIEILKEGIKRLNSLL